MESESPRLRLSILGICIFSLFAVLLARLYYLQVLAPEQGAVRSSSNPVRTIVEEAPRGRVLDAKGRILVDNRTSLIVTIDRTAIEKVKDDAKADLLLRLARQLTKEGVPTKVTDLERKLADPQYSPLQPVPIASDVPEALMVYFAEHADDYPGVVVKRGTVRVYPYGPLAAHVLGWVGRISQESYTQRMGTPEERKTPPKPYEVDSSIGQAGIEATMEDELRGTPGERQVEVDARGRIISVVTERAPIPGNDVQLTIDIDIQKDAEEKLKAQLDERRGKGPGFGGANGALFEGKAGSTIVEDPRNGNVIAMASYPTYDPSEFVNGISLDRYQQLQGNGNRDDNALLNRAISEQYSPGSTFKLVTAYAALSTGVLKPNETYYDSGSYKLGNTTLRNAEGAEHGRIDITRAITVSSDVFFYWIGAEKFGSDNNMNQGIQDTARLFGLGERTGVQLPNEAKGAIPDPASKRELWKALHPDNPDSVDGNWFGGDSANLAVGQGSMQLTPLQLTNMYAAFANGGNLHQPNLVLRVLSTGTDGTQFGQPACDEHSDLATAKCVVDLPQPFVKRQIPMPSELYDPIRRGLDGVTKASDATATGLFQGFDQGAFPIFGKTGTIENQQGRADNSTFVGVGPANDPQYVINAYTEHMGVGAEGAGPIVRNLFDLVANQRPVQCPPLREGGPPTTVPAGQQCPSTGDANGNGTNGNANGATGNGTTNAAGATPAGGR